MRYPTVILLIATAVIGCSPDAKQSDTASVRDSAAATAADSGGMSSMPGMAAAGGSGTVSMIADMKAKLDDIEKLDADSLAKIVQDHRSKAAALLSEMNREMASMQMQGDAAWSTMADSVRRDLITLPETNRAGLKTLMAAHRGRMLRLMQMHADMMKH